MTELWKDICFTIDEYRKADATEEKFQIEVAHIFEKLGWSRFRGEIIRQETISVGSAQSVKPDIVISSGGSRNFVVELKKPNAGLMTRNTEQLISYMRLLRLSFGILLGDTLQIYYEVPDDNKPPVLLADIPFTPDNKDGVTLVELITKSGFSDEALSKWCATMLKRKSFRKQAKEVVSFLCSTEGSAMATEELRRILLEQYPSETVDIAIDKIDVRIALKQNDLSTLKPIVSRTSPTERQHTSHMPSGHSTALQIDLIPPSDLEFKRLLLERKYAVINIYYEDGHVERKPWRARNFKERSDVIGNMRSRPEFRKGEWQRRGIKRLVVEIEKQ